VGTKRQKTDIGWKERKEDAECAMRRERDNGAHVEKMLRNEKGLGDRKNVIFLFFEIVNFILDKTVIRNPKACRANKA
jgi:hypothetical protein